MDKKYSFLSDEEARMEIRKHQWIESEKLRKELSFSQAALDWIKRFGHQWLRGKRNRTNADRFFLEKRLHRRFSWHIPLSLEIGKEHIKGQIHDFNLVAFSCFLTANLVLDQLVDTTIHFPSDGTRPGRETSPGTFPVRFVSRVLRYSPAKQKISSDTSRFVLSFNELVRDYLRNQTDVISGLTAAC